MIILKFVLLTVYQKPQLPRKIKPIAKDYSVTAKPNAVCVTIIERPGCVAIAVYEISFVLVRPVKQSEISLLSCNLCHMRTLSLSRCISFPDLHIIGSSP